LPRLDDMEGGGVLRVPVGQGFGNFSSDFREEIAERLPNDGFPGQDPGVQ
jgi:hypothetical protein